MSTMSWSEYMSTELPPVDIWLFLYAYILLHILTLAKNFSHFIFNYVKLAWLWRNFPGSINPYYFVEKIRRSRNVYEFEKDMNDKFGQGSDFFKLVNGPQLELFACSDKAYDSLFFQKEHLTDTVDQNVYIPAGTLGELFGHKSLPVLRNSKRYPRERSCYTKQSSFVENFLPKTDDLKPGNPVFDSIWIHAKEVLDIHSLKVKSVNRMDQGSRVNVFSYISKYVDANIKVLLCRDLLAELGTEDAEENIVEMIYTAQRSCVNAIFARMGISGLAALLPFPFDKLALYCGNNFGKENTIYQEHKDKVRRWVFEVIKIVRKKSLDDVAQCQDMASQYLKDNMWDDEILYSAFSLCLAGTYNGSLLLGWTIYWLSKNPNVQKELYEELTTYMNCKGISCLSSITATELEELPYLNGVIREAGRLTPPTAHNLVDVGTDLEFYDGTKIPKGTRITYAPYAYGNSSDNYEDVTKFYPRRWIESDKAAKLLPGPKHNFELRDRKCLGQYYARFQTKVFVAKLALGFELSIDKTDEEDIGRAAGVFLEFVNKQRKDIPEIFIRVSPRA
eukprot:snap_masked-scaffold_6-processed-gene-2.22-mRNA-1 protein AED:1.00 eAED:1.00 QI:0/-1/0/0/-1/1/1/0/561